MMFCTIYRWLISRSLDSGGPLSPRTAGHVGRCETCRDYHARSVELTDRLTSEARRRTGAVSDELHARILLRCGAGAEAAAPRPMPRMNVRRVRPPLVAAAVAAAVLVVLAAWLMRPAVSPTPEVIAPNLNPSPHRVPDYSVEFDLRWHTALAKANDAFDRSIDSEFERLGQSGLAAAEFVLARMPIDIDLP